MTASLLSAPTAGHQDLRKAKVVDRLLRSQLFRSYQEIFQASTGLPLELHAVDDREVTACCGSVNQNRFCHLLNSGSEGCRECLVAQKCLSRPDQRGVQSIACFAGLQETAVPVTAGNQVVAQLKTGQIFHERPKKKEFQKVAALLDDVAVDSGALEKAYMETPIIEKKNYQAMITLLASFSLQLTKLANQIAREEESGAEDVMNMVLEYIEENITESLCLDDLAAEFHMSTFHFCRKFKETTGMTLTQYITECRINLAKDALHQTEQRITDVAFDVGFQSLSQFNRSFHKLTGMSPSKFRKVS